MEKKTSITKVMRNILMRCFWVCLLILTNTLNAAALHNSPSVKGASGNGTPSDPYVLAIPQESNIQQVRHNAPRRAKAEAEEEDLVSCTINLMSAYGMVSFEWQVERGSSAMLLAYPVDCYTFTQWNDGVTANPRMVVLTQDTTFTAEYVLVQYQIQVQSADGEQGTISAGTTANVVSADVMVGCGDTIQISANAQTGYYFKRWQDNSTMNPRNVVARGNASYTAYFDYQQYEITFQNEDGTILQQSDVPYGTMPSYSGTTPTKASTAEYVYTFTGWSPSLATVTGPATYTAQYQEDIHQYQITFQNEDGAILQQTYVNYGDMPDYTGATPTKPATAQYTFTFQGWDKTLATVTQDEIYTAVYTSTVNKYVIIFQDEDGTLFQKDTLNYGDMPDYTGATPTKPATAQYTYTFFGWDKEVDTVVGDETYTAIYTSNVIPYQITFKDEDGTILQQTEVDYGTIPTYEGTTPTKTGTVQYTYVFAGWSPTVMPVTGVAEYTATYQEIVNKYFITFENEDGTILQQDSITYGSMPTYTGATPTKEATPEFVYTFTGWSPEIVTVTGEATYTAQYSQSIHKHLIVFQNEDGTILQQDSLDYGATPMYTGATPTKPATAQYTYTFTGWTPTVSTVTGPEIYVASYTSTVNQYTIIFRDEDGTELQRDVLDYGEMPAYAGAAPTKAGDAQYSYTFNGWSPNVAMVIEDAIYTATYLQTVNQYTVIFENEDGTILQQTDIEYGVVPAYAGATPTKESTPEFVYTFSGWSPAIVAVTGDATYTAQFSQSIHKHPITFQNEDGTILQQDSLDYGTMPHYDGATPTKEATAQYTFTFLGWDKTIVLVTGPETYTATYTSTVNQYTITFQDDDGTELQQDVLDYGDMPDFRGATPTKPATAQYTYTFFGWDKPVTNVVGDETYTAVYADTINKYQITFQNEDGTILQQTDVEYGQVPEYAGETPTKAGNAEFTYTFSGWSPTVTSVTGAATYTAQFQSTTNEYTITFQNEDGTILQQTDIEYGIVPVYAGETPTKAATPEFVYTFTGWSPSIVIVTGAATYTAQYSQSIHQHEIIFQNEDGTVLQREDLDYGDTPVYAGPVPEKDPTAQYTYTFNGWDKPIVTVTGPEIYLATYTSTVNQYTITFQDEDGTLLQQNVLDYGEMPQFTGVEPTKAGDVQYSYPFSGWSPAVATVTGDQTYTATYQQTINQYTITFQNEDGTILQQTDVDYGTIPQYTGETPTKAATSLYVYTFSGWTPTVVAVTGAATYTAQYTQAIHLFEIIFQNEDGTVLQLDSMDYGTTPQYTGEVPTKEPTAQYTYYFNGWDKPIVPVTGEEVYTATYISELNTYNITFLDDDSTVLQFTSMDYGDMPQFNGGAPSKPATAQYTYTFIGWDKPLVTVTGDETYVAVYSSTVNQYLISFLDDDGTPLQETMMQYGDSPVYTGPTPTMQSNEQYTYTFNGWDKPVVPVVGDEEYYATYLVTVNRYVITFQDEDGIILQQDTIEYGEFPHYDGEIPTKQGDEMHSYLFFGWDSPITAVTQDKTYTTVFTMVVNTFPITFLNDDSTLLIVEDVAYGSVPVYTGPTPTKEGTAEIYYTFAGWDRALDTVAGPSTYVATYTSGICRYTVTFQLEDGTILQKTTMNYGDMPVYEGETPVQPSTPQFSYTFRGWDPWIEPVTGNVVYTAIFSVSIDNCIITTSGLEGGMGIGGGLYPYGAYATLTAKPDHGYYFTQWSDGCTDNPRVVHVIQDSTFVAEFSTCPRIVTNLTKTITRGEVYYLGDQALTEAGMYSDTLAGIHGCDSIIFLELHVMLPQITYSIRVIPSDAALGTTTGTGKYYKGDTITISATANANAEFDQWSDGNTDNPRQVVVTKNTTYTAMFSMLRQIDIRVNNSAWGSASYTGVPKDGQTITCVAAANSGCVFVHWVDGNGVVVSTNATYSLVVDGDVTLTAVFQQSPKTDFTMYNIRAQSSDTTLGTTIGSGRYRKGTYATITAVPNQGCEFVRWSDGNTDNPRQVLVTKNATYIARFTRDCMVDISVNNTNWGDAYYIGVPKYLETIACVATPVNRLYTFIHWIDENGAVLSTDNPYAITLTGDVKLKAIFMKSPTIVVTRRTISRTTSEDEIEPLCVVYAENRRVNVTEIRAQYVAIYDAEGKLITWQNNAEDIDLSLPAGVYVIKADNQVEKFIIQ